MEVPDFLRVYNGVGIKRSFAPLIPDCSALRGYVIWMKNRIFFGL